VAGNSGTLDVKCQKRPRYVCEGRRRDAQGRHAARSRLASVSGDGYGEHADGRPFDGTGIGRAWPLLTGERAHYELAAGRRDVAQQFADALVEQPSADSTMAGQFIAIPALDRVRDAVEDHVRPRVEQDEMAS
jgi:hypothetical protein